MRIERVVLEHHGDVAVLRRQVVDHPLADPDVARGDRLEPGDHPQQRRFSAARRPDQNDELAVGNADRHAVDHLHGAVGLAHIDDIDRSHASFPSTPGPPGKLLHRRAAVEGVHSRGADAEMRRRSEEMHDPNGAPCAAGGGPPQWRRTRTS